MTTTIALITAVNKGSCQITIYDDQNYNNIWDFEEANASCAVTVTKEDSDIDPDSIIWVTNDAINTTHLSIEEKDLDMVCALYHQVMPLIKQSPLLNPWLKTEVRLIVCQVHRNSDNQKQFDNKPIFHIYSYDKTGHYFGMQTYDQVSKFYIANPKMAYFEIRLNACPYKSSQCYNFGISQISIKGWPYGL